MTLTSRQIRIETQMGLNSFNTNVDAVSTRNACPHKGAIARVIPRYEFRFDCPDHVTSESLRRMMEITVDRTPWKNFSHALVKTQSRASPTRGLSGRKLAGRRCILVTGGFRGVEFNKTSAIKHGKYTSDNHDYRVKAIRLASIKTNTAIPFYFGGQRCRIIDSL